MAQMYPSSIEGRCDPRSREDFVFEQLKQNLPDDWVVLYSIGDRSQRYYEADFVVLIPHHGFVVLEVKNSRMRVEKGVWQFWHSDDGYADGQWDDSPHGGPVNQAFRAAKKFYQQCLDAELITEGELEYTHAAILLRHDDDNEVKCSPPDFARILWGEGVLKSPAALRTWLLNQFSRGERRYFTTARIADICDATAPSRYFRMNYNEYLDCMEKATADISRLFALTENSCADVLVEGCAGSGKTVLLTNEVKRLTEKARACGERILVLCYNKNLKLDLQKKLKAFPDEVRVEKKKIRIDKKLSQNNDVVRVENFHSLVAWLAEKHGITADYFKPRPGLTEEEIQAGQLRELRALESKLKQAPPTHETMFHHVFIDEAQDMLAPWWEHVLPYLHGAERSNGSTGRLYIFADSNQKLYTQDLGIPECTMRVNLTKNLRNSTQIAEYSARLLPQDQRPQIMNALQGVRVNIEEPGFDSPAARHEAVDHIIRGLLTDKEMKVNPSDIVILSPYRHDGQNAAESILADCGAPDKKQEAEKGNFRQRKVNLDGRTHSIRASTIKGFKGLESLFIILTDIDGFDSTRALTSNDFYVACTRAKYGLHIVPTTGGAKEVRKYLKQD